VTERVKRRVQLLIMTVLREGCNLEKTRGMRDIKQETQNFVLRYYSIIFFIKSPEPNHNVKEIRCDSVPFMAAKTLKNKATHI